MFQLVLIDMTIVFACVFIGSYKPYRRYKQDAYALDVIVTRPISQHCPTVGYRKLDVDLFPYWLLFIAWSAGAIQAERVRTHDSRLLPFIIASILTSMMIGLRFEVGGDWFNYTRIYESIFFLSLPSALSFTDPAYAGLNWLSAQGDLGIWPTNLVCGILFMGGFARLAWKQPNPFLAVVVGVPYLIIVVAMGYTRQAAAIGIICYVIADISEHSLLRTVILIGIAALFHKSAVLILPLALFPILKRNILLGITGFFLFLILFAFILKDSSDHLLTNYVNGNYDAQGAAIRISMNVIAAITFLTFKDRIDMTPYQKSFWSVSSIFAIVSVGGLVAASASVGIDRISLYLIPLQAITFSRLPYFLGRNNRIIPSALFAVIGYSFAVQFIWLNYATNANGWIPFQMSFKYSD